MKQFISIVTTCMICSSLFACSDGHEKAVKEERNAQKDLSVAQGEVDQRQVESQKAIDEARARGGVKEIEAAKIDATTKLAGAEEKVDDKKVAQSKAIADAKRDAGEVSGTLQHE